LEKTAERIAQEFGVDEKTIRRDEANAKRAEADVGNDNAAKQRKTVQPHIEAPLNEDAGLLVWLGCSPSTLHGWDAVGRRADQLSGTPESLPKSLRTKIR
jgi:hypothetical protein